MSMSNFGKIGQSVTKILKVFQFFKVADAAILNFQICEISFADRVWKAQTHHRAKCRQNQKSCYGDIGIFRIFKMAVAAILDCRIHKISLADSIQMAQTHHFAKFRENWSFHCGDGAIFRIFKMTTTAILHY